MRPGGTPDFCDVRISRAGSVRRPEVDVEPEDIRDLAYSIIRVLDRDGEAVGPWAGLLSDEELLEGLRHMMTLRAFDARMLMAQRQGKTSFYMQHMGEEAVSCAFRKALAAGRHELPDLSPGRAADRRRLSAGRHDVPDLLQRARPAEGPPAAGDVFVAASTASSRSPATSRRSTSRRSAGRWRRRSRATRRSPPAGSATARPPNRTSTPRWSSPRPTRRRWCSTSSTTSGRSRPSRASPAAAPAPSRRAASASASRRCGSTATTISRSMPWRNGRPSGRARNLGPDAHRVRHLSRRRAFHLRRSRRPTGRRPSPTPGRSATR